MALNPALALPQVNRQARRLAGLPVPALPQFRPAGPAEGAAEKRDRLRRQMAAAFMSALTRDRRLAIAERGRRARAAVRGVQASAREAASEAAGGVRGEQRSRSIV